MRKFFRYWLNALRGEPEKNAYNSLQDAFKINARRIAEGEYHKRLIEFYTNRTKAIDPYTSAQSAQDFADAMWQAEHHTNDLNVELMRADESMAKVQACYDRLQALQETSP